MAIDAERRLAVYGSLAPGGPHHRELACLDGTWRSGTVRGHLRSEGWGATLGYPGIELDADGEEVAVGLLESLDLPAHWDRVDGFEGPGYRRVVAPVRTAAGTVQAQIYVLAEPSGVRARRPDEPAPR